MHSPPSIAIIGAGPSGLLFARLLEVNGLTDYTIYERDESSTPGQWQQGGSLDLHGPSGQLALKEAGLFDEFNKVYARWDASLIHILNSSGETVGRFGEGRDAPEIDRLQLRQLILGHIPAHKIKWGHGVRSIERKEKKLSNGRYNEYIVHFLNSSSATGFDLIVGADGGWSKVRPLVSQ
jgi:2-polyprenyl-6-methoxyphenol hydroxylase-like FAD-dependent oxidoreductase